MSVKATDAALPPPCPVAQQAPSSSAYNDQKGDAEAVAATGRQHSLNVLTVEYGQEARVWFPMPKKFLQIDGSPMQIDTYFLLRSKNSLCADPREKRYWYVPYTLVSVELDQTSAESVCCLQPSAQSLLAIAVRDASFFFYFHTGSVYPAQYVDQLKEALKNLVIDKPNYTIETINYMVYDLTEMDSAFRIKLESSTDLSELLNGKPAYQAILECVSSTLTLPLPKNIVSICKQQAEDYRKSQSDAATARNAERKAAADAAAAAAPVPIGQAPGGLLMSFGQSISSPPGGAPFAPAPVAGKDSGSGSGIKPLNVRPKK